MIAQTAYDAHDVRGHALDGFVRGYACVERVRSAENSRASGAMPCQAVLLAVARPELPLSTEGKGHVRVFGRKDGCHRSCRRTAEYRNRSQSAQPRGLRPPLRPAHGIARSMPSAGTIPHPDTLHAMSDLSARVIVALRNYEKDNDLGALFDSVNALADTHALDDLIAVAEEHRDRHEIVIPVYERVTSQRPNDARALVVLANAYWLTGRGPEVVGELASRAIRADATNRAAWHLWALSEGDVRARVERWQQVTDRFPDDLLARAALADNAASLAGAEHDPLALDLAVRTYEGLWQESPTPTQRRALEETLATLRGWKL
jgi:hypothetical protein